MREALVMRRAKPWPILNGRVLEETRLDGYLLRPTSVRGFRVQPIGLPRPHERGP
jgi:hypothetical protein